MVTLTDRAARSRTAGTMSGVFPLATSSPPAPTSRRDGPAPNRRRRHRRVDGRAAGHQPHPGGARADAAGGHRHHAAHAGQVHQGVRRAARPHDAVERARSRAGRRRHRRRSCWWRRARARWRCGARTASSRSTSSPQQPDDRYVPSVDRMLTMAALAMGSDLLGIVLTGMGGDGGRGVRSVKGAGGRYDRRGAGDGGHLRHAAGGDRHRRRRRSGAARQHPRPHHALRPQEVASRLHAAIEHADYFRLSNRL